MVPLQRAGYVNPGPRDPMQCEYPDCPSTDATERPSLTCYVNNEGVPTDQLNPKPVLCDGHWAEYEDYWLEMWAEYRSSQGV